MLIVRGAPVKPGPMVTKASGEVKSTPAVALPPRVNGIMTADSEGTLSVIVSGACPAASAITARVGEMETTGIGSSSKIVIVPDTGVPRVTFAAARRSRTMVCDSSRTRSSRIWMEMEAVVEPAGIVTLETVSE